MKIRFLIKNAYAVGGTIRTTLSTAARLAEHHDVEVVSLKQHLDEPVLPVDPRVRLRALVDASPAYLRRQHARRDPVARTRRRLREWAEEQPSRIVHPQEFRYDQFDRWQDLALYRYIRSVRRGVLVGTRPGLNLAIARYGRSSAVLVGQEHLHLGIYPKGIRKAMRELYPRLDAMSTLTARDAELYAALLGPQARLVTVPNGVPSPGTTRSPLAEKVVISAGRLSPQKGFDRLISAFAKVAAKHPDWQLRIFGDGRRREALQARIDRLGVGANVTLMGFTDRLDAEMAAASLYVMSSRFEGFPMVLLEAMGCGLPVVSFDCPNGPRDLITEGKDGMIVADGDVDGLAAAIVEMIEDPARRAAFGAAALEKAEQYDTGRLAERWVEIFTDLAAAKGVRL